MRHCKVFYPLVISLFWLFSCQEKTQNRESDVKTTSLESKFESISEYNWIRDFGNFYEETYQEKYKQLLTQSLNEKKFEDAAAYLIAYGIAAKQTQNIDTAYVAEAIEFLEKHQDKISGEAISTLSHYIGAQYKNARQIQESNKWFENSFSDKIESDTHHQSIGLSHLLMGQNYFEQRDLGKAEKHLVTALEIFEKIGDRENKAKVSLMMHSMYVRNGAYDKAESILEEAIDIFEKEKSEFYALTGHIFYVHYHLEKYDTIKAIAQIDKMNKFAKSYKDITEYHSAILNLFLSMKFMGLKQEDSASYYLNQAKEITERTGIPDLQMRTFFTNVSYANKFGKPLENPEEVEAYFNALFEGGEENSQYLVQLAVPLYFYNKKEGNFEKANIYSEYLISDAYNQSAKRVEHQLFELETKYQTERKEKTILQQEQKIEQKNKIIYWMILGAVVILFTFVILFFWFKNKSILREKKLTENFASQLLQKTESERKRIASDLHDSVSNELVNLRHIIDEKDVSMKMKIDGILEEVRNISRNISPTLFDKIGLELSIEQLVERIQTQHDFFLSSEIDYKGGISNEKELQLYRIIQEAITNILKHADAVAGKITMQETDQSIIVEIKDNGKGFDVEKMLEKGNCFGLLNIRERAKYLNGYVHFHSDKNGTIVKITIPKE